MQLVESFGVFTCLTLVLLLGGCQKPAPSAPAEAPAAARSPGHDSPVGEPAAKQASPESHEHAAHDHSQHTLAAATPLADLSLYHLKASLTDQDGRSLELASLRGKNVLVTMFYASCQTICPMLISQIQRIDAALPTAARAQTQVLLVSLDPARDDAAKLKEVAGRHSISDPRWHFVRTQPDSVREIAALLGVRYAQLPSGEISHSPTIVLLDREGVIAQRMENAAEDPAPLVAAATKLASTL